MKRLGLLFCSLFVGCGVTNQQVESHPPVIHRDLVSFAMTYGTFKVDQASAFLWPAGLSEDETQALVAKINGASLAADTFMVQAAILGAEEQELQKQWESTSCIEKYAILQPGQDPVDVDKVMEWKAADPNNPHELELCQTNQARRQAIPAEKDSAVRSARPYLDKIISAIDPDPKHPVNSKALEPKGTRISLNEDGSVSVALANFLEAGFNPSTSNGQIINAKYNSNLKVLSFDVPNRHVNDKDYAGNDKGNVYRFAIERGPDNGPLARFTGDMNLFDNGTLIRYGSARFDAFPIPSAQ